MIGKLPMLPMIGEAAWGSRLPMRGSPMGSAEVPRHAMFEELREALLRLSARGRTPVLIHVNNQEDLRAGDLQSAAQLIKELRDAMLMTGGHWIFVGSSGIDNILFQQYSQVA